MFLPGEHDCKASVGPAGARTIFANTLFAKNKKVIKKSVRGKEPKTQTISLTGLPHVYNNTKL